MAEKKGSTESLGFGNEDGSEGGSAGIKDIVFQNPLPYGQLLYDTCVYAIKCPHNHIALRKMEENSLWLPYIFSSAGQKWSSALHSITELFVNDQIVKQDERIFAKKPVIDSMILASISRLQLPHEEFITRITFTANWTSSETIVCCKTTDHFEWHPIDAIISGRVDRLWGSEVVEFATLLGKNVSELNKEPVFVTEYTNQDVLSHISDDNDNDNNDSPEINSILWTDITKFLKNTFFDENIVQKLYTDFIQHCYPSLDMSWLSFHQYTIKLGIEGVEGYRIRRAFNALNYKRTGYLSFTESLIGIAVLDPQSPHCLIRATFIFRFYDKDCDGFLDKTDIKEMVNDIKLRDLKEHKEGPELEEQVIHSMKLHKRKAKIDLNEFISVIKKSKLVDIRRLFRSKDSIHKLISNKHIYEPIGKGSKGPESKENKNYCPNCRLKNYTLSVHTIRMSREGRLCNPMSILFTDGKDIKFNVEEDKQIENQRRHSTDISNNVSSLSNKVLDMIRDFAKNLRKDVSDQTKSDLKLSFISDLTPNIIKEICEEIVEIFRAEPRVLKVQSPIYVLGDLHGNLTDLNTFEDQLWRTAPICMPTNLLFVGDYVDRGKYSIECVLYLYSLKILNPNQVFILRGNHEIRSVQKTFTFEAECVEKYKNDGQKVFEMINQTFDVMPIVAIIDESIYCAHGGIPFSMDTIGQLMNIPCPLKEPEKESPATWEILWSDPMDTKEFKECVEYMNESLDTKFLPNTKRGTAYVYSETALNEFFSANNLTQMIRGHEMKTDGYHFQLDGKVITVFSSSRYCGANNKAAVVSIDGHKNEGFIKIISLET